MRTVHVVENGLLKTIEVDDEGKRIAKPTVAALPSTLADPSKALTFSTNFTDANAAAVAAGTRLAPSTIQTIQTVQAPNYLAKFGNAEVTGDVIYKLMDNIFSKINAPIGLANKLLILQNYNIHILIDDSGSMDGPRWNQALTRLIEMMDLLQVVPTGPVTLSFLNRRDRLTINRKGKTPAQFYQEATTWINQEFQRRPAGGTPIYSNINNMFRWSQGQTAHYIITDGVPTGYGSDREDIENEIRDIKNRVLRRSNPKGNPVTFMCCSEQPADTEWMHEVEEIACIPGANPGYVAALQNFEAERLEVLNDQGAWLPYTRSVWLICSLVAALNPNDLDALDQHAPLSKSIVDSFLGRVSTITEYTGYFLQHPNATWLFKEDFELFVNTEITNQIPAVNYFERVLGQKLNDAINRGDDTSEFVDLANTEQMVLSNFQRERPQTIFNQRMSFWTHYFNMETQQLNSLRYERVVSQHLWADYIAYSGMGNMWQNYLQGCHPLIAAVVERFSQQQQQPPNVEGQEPPPPPYSAEAQTLYPPQEDTYNKPNYYRGYIPTVTRYNQSGSQTMWTPPPAPPQYNNQQYQSDRGYQPSPGCCTIS